MSTVSKQHLFRTKIVTLATRRDRLRDLGEAIRPSFTTASSAIAEGAYRAIPRATAASDPQAPPNDRRSLKGESGALKAPPGQNAAVRIGGWVVRVSTLTNTGNGLVGAYNRKGKGRTLQPRTVGPFAARSLGIHWFLDSPDPLTPVVLNLSLSP